MAASVSTRVVSWNEAAEMNDSVDSDALVIPSSSGVPSAGSPPRFITFSFSSMTAEALSEFTLSGAKRLRWRSDESYSARAEEKVRVGPETGVEADGSGGRL